MKISIVIPFYNEEACAARVIAEARKAMPEAEIIAVDDGSTDETGRILSSLSDIRVVSLPENKGKGVAVYEGFLAANGDVLVLMDGDGQNDPGDIAAVVDALETADCAWGYRVDRADGVLRRLAGAIGNAARRSFLGDDGVRDVGCALRAFRREHLRHLRPFEGLHRFMPTFFSAAGLSIAEIPVSHRPRLAGSSRYTIAGRALRGAFDIASVKAKLA
jgi:dolichol-phosphate mannosyltransferase